jgi:competence protein ComEC
VLGSAAAVLCILWPTGAQLLIRFAGPELWWVLTVAQWAADVPAATVPVPSGTAGVLVVGGATAAILLLALRLWRWRWFRLVVGLGGAGVVIWELAWSLSGLVGPS